ncbi:MAG: glycerate kinase [Candidatus Dormiibacterota bacterium]
MLEVSKRTHPLRVVIAPNAFKGTLTSPEAARAIGEGVVQAWPGAACRAVPLADGGDGFLDTLLAAPGSDRLRLLVPGPLLEPVSATVGWPGGQWGHVAVVELADCSGLSLVEHPSPDTSRRASTRGLGELILAALAHRAERVLIGLGGSASTDGGAGLGQALGFRLLDRDGEPIRPGGIGLIDLDRIDRADASPLLRDKELLAACDVESPLLGRLGAAATFSPQKGADPSTVRLLERGLARLVQIVERDLHLPAIKSEPRMGAAGGTAFGLAAFGGARLESGVSLVASWVGLDDALDRAQLVITGEGRVDRASLRGKVTGEVLRRAASRQLPCLVLAGSAEAEAEEAARELGGRVVLTSARSGLPSGLTHRAALSELREAAKWACLSWAEEDGTDPARDARRPTYGQ